MVTTKKIDHFSPFFLFFFSPIRSLDCLYQCHWCQIMAVGIFLKQRIFVKISLMIRAHFNHLCAKAAKLWFQRILWYQRFTFRTSKTNFNYANNKIKNFKSNFTMRWQFYNILLGTIAVWFKLYIFSLLNIYMNV